MTRKMVRQISLKRIKEQDSIADNLPVEYVIYVRKSTDESSGKQTQSIPDQIKLCVKYLEDNKLMIKHKDSFFSEMFETAKELETEDNETDTANRKVYQSTRKFAIIKEQHSATKPGLRPKWKKLIQLIRKGKIKGLISYSPDRQARNTLEGGEIVDLLDEGLLTELKYTNFYFENTASGKMMLNVRFALSKQYVDKLSEDVTRGLNSRSANGKSFGVYKYGYTITQDPDTKLYNGYHKPHPVYFDMMQKAFKMKLYEKRSDDYIVNKLIEMGFKKEHRGKESDLNYNNSFYEVWLDPFYYGIFQYGERQSNLNDTNELYRPMISEDEYKILMDRYYGETDYQSLKAIKEEHYEIMPFEEGFVKAEDSSLMTFNLPNKNRFYKKLEKEKIKNKDVLFSDVVNPNQIRYKCCNPKSSFYGIEITYDKIQEAIIEMLDNISITDDMYNEYVEEGKRKLDDMLFKSSQERNLLTLQYGKVTKSKNEFIKSNLGKDRTDDENLVYNNELKKYNDIRR